MIISVRPYCFWVKQSRDAVTLPYMLPKYSSSDVLREEFEAKMLLMQNNNRPLLVAALIGAGLINAGMSHAKHVFTELYFIIWLLGLVNNCRNSNPFPQVNLTRGQTRSSQSDPFIYYICS